MQRLQISILLVLISLGLSGCGDNPVVINAELNGQWVEIVSNSDTLEFSLWGDQQIMMLDRGKELVNGVMVPKIGSGPYEYQLLPNNIISLRWTLSSSSAFNDYYFSRTDNKLVIENFFDPDKAGTILTFIKLE